MRWIREAHGVYSSDDDKFHLTFIPAHWEVTFDGFDREAGEEPAVWDAPTLARAKESVVRWTNP